MVDFSWENVMSSPTHYYCEIDILGLITPQFASYNFQLKGGNFRHFPYIQRLTLSSLYSIYIKTSPQFFG